MRIENKKIVLRSMVVSDIADVMYWNRVETEWMQWDAPWLHEKEDSYDWAAYEKRKREEIAQSEDTTLKMRLEVCVNDEEETHIGSISCYFIDDAYRIDNHGSNIAIGMDSFETKHRGKGYGKASYQAYIEYLKTFGYVEIYTQTWSGNVALIHMAEHLGFKECNRYIGSRQVRNQTYDGLTLLYKAM